MIIVIILKVNLMCLTFQYLPDIVSGLLIGIYIYLRHTHHKMNMLLRKGFHKCIFFVVRFQRKNIKHMFIFEELDSMNSYNQMKVMAIFLRAGGNARVAKVLAFASFGLQILESDMSCNVFTS